MIRVCVFITIFFFVSVKSATACNGYTVTLHNYGNCVPNGVLSLPNKNGNIVLDNDCNIILTGCLDIKPFKTAKGTYHITKAPLPPIEGDFDLCDLANDTPESVDTVLDMFGMPKRCPMPAKKICSGPSKKINISKYKNQIGMAAGKINVKLEMTHDTGKTCLEASLTISKAKRG